MSVGYFLIAQNTENVNYLKMAYCLALSIKQTQSKYTNISVAVSPEMIIPDNYKNVFDKIITIPRGDMAANSAWKLENEWKVYYMTPYKHTIKLEADMLFTNNVDYIFDDILHNEYDYLFCNRIKSYRNENIIDLINRKEFIDNNLSNVYSCLSYFNKNNITSDFFKNLELVTKNWKYYFSLFCKNNVPEYFSTDIAYAIAIKLSKFNVGHNILEFVHLKTNIQNINGDIYRPFTDYYNYYIDKDNFYINGYKQNNIIHYHDKNFINDDIITIYEKELNL